MTIKQAIEKIFPELILNYRAWSGLIRKRNSYLHTTGWLKSLRARKPINNNGKPIPWMNYAIKRILDERLKHDFTLFEYGSGYSTKYFSEKVKFVTTVEYDHDWFERINKMMPKNVELIYMKKDIDGNYCRVIKNMTNQYDLIIIDGRDRLNCLKHSFDSLSERGVIIFDDSQRKRYRGCQKIAQKHGFRSLNIEGIKPTGTELDIATIFYRDGNCLEI